MAGLAFLLEAADGEGNPVITFNPPLTLTVHYDKGAAQDEASLDIYRYDTGLGEWNAPLQTLDMDLDTFVLLLDQVGEFALLEPIETGGIIYLPLIVRYPI